MRFGKSKGTPLANLEVRDIESARQWAANTDASKFASAIEELDQELERRREIDEQEQGSLGIDGGKKQRTGIPD